MFRDCLTSLYTADLAAEHLRSAGVPATRERWDAPNGQRIAYVADPDGNRVRCYG
jgi:catechol 2,3-dioxygenase-like lactoylglutathione lyase family enzyme